MRAPRSVPVLLLAILAFLAAGCGSSTKSPETGGGTTPAGAGLVGASTLAFVSIDSDLSSDQWQQLDTLSQKFPGRDHAIAQLKQALAGQGLDYNADLKPALGPEFDVAVDASTGAGSANVVGLTKPDDPSKFQTLVKKMNSAGSTSSTAVTRDLGDGWWGIAGKAQAFDAVLKGSGSALADNATFSAAMKQLPADALVKAYVDGPQLGAFIRKSAAQSGSSFDTTSLGLDKLKYVSAAAAAEADGLRVRGASSGDTLGGGDFASKLVEGVPGDAFAFLAFQGKGTTDQLDKLQSNPQFGPALTQIQSQLGVPFRQVLALLGNEVAFWVRPSIGIPEFTLALDPDDESAALATLDKLAARLAAATGGRVVSGQQGGHEVKTVNLGRFEIHYGSVDGKILITSGLNGIADYGSGEQLADSADFKEAKDASGLPDENSGMVYIDLKNALPLLETFAGLAGQGLPSDVTENLRPLRSFVAWSSGSGDSRTFDAFLEIK